MDSFLILKIRKSKLLIIIHRYQWHTVWQTFFCYVKFIL